MLKTTKTPKKVQLFVPKSGSPDDTDVFISVNGTNYILPRGKTSEVPDFVAAEFARAEAAKDRFYETSLKKQFKDA